MRLSNHASTTSQAPRPTKALPGFFVLFFKGWRLHLWKEQEHFFKGRLVNSVVINETFFQNILAKGIGLRVWKCVGLNNKHFSFSISFLNLLNGDFVIKLVGDNVFYVFTIFRLSFYCDTIAFPIFLLQLFWTSHFNELSFYQNSYSRTQRFGFVHGVGREHHCCFLIFHR